VDALRARHSDVSAGRLRPFPAQTNGFRLPVGRKPPVIIGALPTHPPASSWPCLPLPTDTGPPLPTGESIPSI
jgi:hypothetical protein